MEGCLAKCFLVKKFALWRATMATLTIKTQFPHMIAVPILSGGGMAWKVLMSPLAQVCVFFFTSNFFFSSWWAFLLLSSYVKNGRNGFHSPRVRLEKSKGITYKIDISLRLLWIRQTHAGTSCYMGDNLNCKRSRYQWAAWILMAWKFLFKKSCISPL